MKEIYVGKGVSLSVTGFRYHPCSPTNEIKSKYISRVRSFVSLSKPVYSASWLSLENKKVKLFFW